MRENRSQTTPRRRGPKLPLPRTAHYRDEDEGRLYGGRASESPYYTIDNTEDIYGTTLSPAQRSYVDPWDLENYDYVRKKISSPPTPTADDYYDASLSPSPAEEPFVDSSYHYFMQPRMAATMPRNNNRRRSQHFQCDLPCCAPYPDNGVRRHYEDLRRDNLYGLMSASVRAEEEAQALYGSNGYEAFSSGSSTERHSSIEDDSLSTLMMQHKIQPNRNRARDLSYVDNVTLTRNRRKTAASKPQAAAAPQPPCRLEFPAPPTVPPPPAMYDYCNPYATLPCSVSDCYECLSSMYGSSAMYSSATLGRRPSAGRSASSLYEGIYSSKFGLSKKGLLQIDYSCSWNDLNRVMGRYH